MRLRFDLLAAALAGAVVLGLGSPPPANACTGCGTSWQEFYEASAVIVLARYRGGTDDRSTFEVIDVLKGRSSHTLRLSGVEGVGRHTRRGSLWLLTPDESAGYPGWSFLVHSDGSVEGFDMGEGSFGDYPGTLAGWYRKLGVRMPDTSTAGSSQSTPSPFPAAMLLASGTLGALLAMRRPTSTRSTAAS